MARHVVGRGVVLLPLVHPGRVEATEIERVEALRRQHAGDIEQRARGRPVAAARAVGHAGREEIALDREDDVSPDFESEIGLLDLPRLGRVAGVLAVIDGGPDAPRRVPQVAAGSHPRHVRHLVQHVGAEEVEMPRRLGGVGDVTCRRLAFLAREDIGGNVLVPHERVVGERNGRGARGVKASGLHVAEQANLASRGGGDDDGDGEIGGNGVDLAHLHQTLSHYLVTKVRGSPFRNSATCPTPIDCFSVL